MLVECPPRRHVDQPLVGHVPEQRLERDLVGAAQREMLGNLALADRRRTVLDKAENLVARGKSGLRLGLFHRASSRWFARSPGDAEAFAWADRPISIEPDEAWRSVGRRKPLRGQRDHYAPRTEEGRGGKKGGRK